MLVLFETHASPFPTPQIKKYVNNVNESTQSLMGRGAFGRRGNKASSVVIQRNPCKEKISVGTWNVRTMLRQGKLANVIREMRKTKLDILGLSEVRWKEGGDFTSDGGRAIYTEAKGGQSGVAVLLEERIAKCVIRAESYKDRLLMVMIKAYPVDIVVMQVYMPTGASEEEEVDNIYEVIEEKLSNIKGSEYAIVNVGMI